MSQTIAWYEDDFCYYLWKPHGIASSFGQWPCFLDIIKNYQYIQDPLLQKAVQILLTEFGEEHEYGLLNRLDTDTCWLLYFAKTRDIKNAWKSLQKKWAITKYYIADVPGNVTWKMRVIGYPIIHHPQSKDRMICLSNSANNIYHKSKLLYCETRVEKLYYDEVRNFSCLLVSINKWVRHQIRCHLAAIGSPIVGERLYKKKKDTGILHLRSIWANI